jgi:hypothetical protein
VTRAASNGQAPKPAQSTRSAYQRAESTALLTCARHDCQANYLNDGPGKQAHKIVFGHAPKAPPAPTGTRP